MSNLRIDAKKRRVRVLFDKKKNKYYIPDGKKKLWLTSKVLDRIKNNDTRILNKINIYTTKQRVRRLNKAYKRYRKQTPNAVPLSYAAQSLQPNNPNTPIASLFAQQAKPQLNLQLYYPGDKKQIVNEEKKPEEKKAPRKRIKQPEPLLIADTSSQSEYGGDEITYDKEGNVIVPKDYKPKPVESKLKHVPTGVAERDDYFVKFTYEGDDGVETTRDLFVPLSLSATDLNKSGMIKQYKKIVQNKQAGKETELTASDGQIFNRIVGDIERNNNVEGKITKISVKNKSLQGAGTVTKGLSDDDINEKMADWPNFVGVIASDELKKLLDDATSKEWDTFGFVMNTLSSKQLETEIGHWVAIYIDLLKDKSVEYYDPFGENPSDEVAQTLYQYVKKLRLPYMLKYKVNGNKMQAEKSDRCGAHCMLFLEDRFNDVNFDEATGFRKDNALVTKSENRAKKFETI